jgi:hypothetical protein
MNRTTLRERKYRDEIEQFQKILKTERDAWLERELKHIVPELVYDWILCKLPAASRYLEEQNIRWEIGKFIMLSKTWTRLTVDLYKGTEVKATMEFDIEHDGSHDSETLHKDVWGLNKK